MNTQTKKLFRMAARIPAGIERKDDGGALALEIKNLKAEIISQIEGGADKVKQMQMQLDALDKKMAERTMQEEPGQRDSFAKQVFDHSEFKSFARNGGRGRAVIVLEGKTLTGGGFGSMTTGVMPIERVPGIQDSQFRQLRIRDLLRTEPTTAGKVDFVKVSSFTNNASPQVEGSSKSESDIQLTSVSEDVQTIAHFVRASKQVLDDLPGFQLMIDRQLIYGLKLKEEQELLSGSGTGVHLNGLITQATAFSTSLLPASGTYNRMDVIARAIQQAERSDYAVDIIVLNTDDFWSMALTKDSQGRYLFGDPATTTVPRLWGRPVAVTNNITSGTFLVGSSQTAVIRDRMEATIDISDSDSDNFTKNLVTIRAEERLALQVFKPASWIRGSLTTSPA